MMIIRPPVSHGFHILCIRLCFITWIFHSFPPTDGSTRLPFLTFENPTESLRIAMRIYIPFNLITYRGLTPSKSRL